MRTIPFTRGIAAAAAGAAIAGLAASAPALGATCPAGTVVTGDQSIDAVKTRILTAKVVTCPAARAVVARNGQYIASSGAYGKGGRFLLGSYACTVTHAPARGAVRARCVNGARIFTVAYRFR